MTTPSWRLLRRLRALAVSSDSPRWMLCSEPLPGLDRYAPSVPRRVLRRRERAGGLCQNEGMRNAISVILQKALAIAILLVAAWVVFHLVIGIVATVAWIIVAVVAVVAVLWAIRIL